MRVVQVKRDGSVAQAAGVSPKDYFAARQYRGRVNCANCGSFYMEITGEDEPNHKVLCKKCCRKFVWTVRDGCVITIGSSLRDEGKDE